MRLRCGAEMVARMMPTVIRPPASYAYSAETTSVEHEERLTTCPGEYRLPPTRYPVNMDTHRPPLRKMMCTVTGICAAST